MYLKKGILTMQKMINGLIFIVLLFLLPACGGVGQSVYKIEPLAAKETMVTVKLNQGVVLKLSQQLCDLKWSVPIGLPYYADLGEAFCADATNMVNHLFENVTVSTSDSLDSKRLTLTPELIQVQKRSALYSYEPTWIRVFVRWTFTDSRGNKLWQDVIDGKGEGTMGGPFSYKDNSIEQFQLALADMFSNTSKTILATAEFLTPDHSEKPYRGRYFDWIQAKHANSAEAFDQYITKHPDSHLLEQAVIARAAAVKNGRLKTRTLCEQLKKICRGMDFRMVEDIIRPALPVHENTFASAHGTYPIRQGKFKFGSGRLVSCPMINPGECPENPPCHPGIWMGTALGCIPEKK